VDNTISIHVKEKEICRIDELGIWLTKYSWCQDPKTVADFLFDVFERCWHGSFQSNPILNRTVDMRVENKLVCLISRDNIWFNSDLVIPDYFTEETIRLLQKRWRETLSKK